MKKVYIFNQNHMDLLWLRCFEEHFCENGHIVRPYVDIEEALFDRWIDIVKNSDSKYSIEQTSTIKKYLERNPDKTELFITLVQNGKIEIMGGGESIIDSNIPCGESIVRNHLYSILWCDKQFKVRPKINTSCDIFGLSAQLPQIMRKLEYNTIANYSRVFDHAKPYWKGLNGDVVLLVPFSKDADAIAAESIAMGDYAKYPHCSDCKGEGCMVCEYTGMDTSHKANMPAVIGKSYDDKNDVFILEGEDIGSLEETLENISQMKCDEVILNLNTEEILNSHDFSQRIDTCSKKLGLLPIYMTNYELVSKFAKKYIDKMIEGRINEDEIDERIEGNPIGTGCYVTRIKLKQHNRELEDLLLSCEKFATYATDLGMVYPRKKIERLWNMMSVLHFHDGITATHKDRCYEELLKYIRNVKLGAWQIYTESLNTITAHITIAQREGYRSFVVFNPLNWEVNNIPMDITIPFPKTEEIHNIEIIDQAGYVIEVLKLSVSDKEACKIAKVTIKSPSVPSVGYTVIYCKNTNGKKIKDIIVADKIECIENEYYKVLVGKNGIESIFDKEINQTIATCGANGLSLESDFGGPWETIREPEHLEDLFTTSDVSSRIMVQKTCQIAIFESHQGMKWKQEITLYKGIKKIYFKTEVDWDKLDSRLRVAFPLSFQTPNDEAHYEIPYGTLKRKKYKGRFLEHMDANGDWPAIHFVCCHNALQDYTVTLFNRGTGSHKLVNGVFYMSLLRSPTLVTALENYDGSDKGNHSFEYCLSSNKGSLKDGKVVQQGLEFNTWFKTMESYDKLGKLKPTHSFLTNVSDNVIVSAIKVEENGIGKVIRMYEAYGEEVVDLMPDMNKKSYIQTNLLEENGQEVEELVFNSFEIKTVVI
jgi:alpha-mannosidase